MGRFLVNIAVVVSLVLSATVAVLWVRGYHYLENTGINWRTSGTSEPVPHHLWLVSSMGTVELRLQNGALLFFAKDPIPPHVYHESIPRPCPLDHLFGDYDPSSLTLTVAHYRGFGYCRAVGGWDTNTDLMVPIWFIELLLLTSPVIAGAWACMRHFRATHATRGFEVTPTA